MHHPWRRLRDRLPDWRIEFVPLPGDTWGETDAFTRTISIDSGLLQSQRRCTITHEIEHAEAGDVGPQSLHRERQVDEAVARRLISLDRLVDAALWAHDVDELADELWVDLPTVRCRLDTLTDAERAAVRTALAVRDFHEEGMP